MSKARDLADGTFDTDTLVVDAGNNRVGMGNVSPQKTLDVRGELAISNGTSSYWNINRDDSDGSLTFTDTDTSERLRILTGGGITFNGDTAADNALSDYEEGTYTPVIEGITTDPTYNINSNRSYYVKVGNFVSVNLDMSLSISTVGSGQILVSLPFVSSSSKNYHSISGKRNNTAFSLYDYEVGGYGANSGNALYMVKVSAVNGGEASITSSDLRTGGVRMCFQFNYIST